jgi:voltage-gated potassium channel Kch
MEIVPDGSNWTVAYVFAIYFILMTMTTIGYGDITPKNPMEAVFTIFIMVRGPLGEERGIVDLLSVIRVHFELHQLDHRRLEEGQSQLLADEGRADKLHGQEAY